VAKKNKPTKKDVEMKKKKELLWHYDTMSTAARDVGIAAINKIRTLRPDITRKEDAIKRHDAADKKAAKKDAEEAAVVNKEIKEYEKQKAKREQRKENRRGRGRQPRQQTSSTKTTRSAKSNG
jgi:hypothetical protein